MEEILENSDIVSVHVSGKPSNRNLISAEQFQIMRSEAIFINLSRGYVVDLEALSYFLKSGKLEFIPKHSEDYCFSRAFNLLNSGG